ncbi:MAG: endonuclease mitochondrial [Sphingomonadales bacterium]|jgi:endonuclease G|nr:endonuclease mitochondrial [Sphingomonadales bacterium]
MGTLQEKLERLRRHNAQIRGSDPALAEEGADVLESLAPAVSDEEALALESIVMRRERPVLAIKENAASLIFADPVDSQIWRERLERAKPKLERAIKAVGRIELKGSWIDWVGTGWLVADTIMVTNRHVANEFVVRNGDGFTFKMGNDGPIGGAVDFLQEIDNAATLVFKLVRPLYVEPSPGPDLAFFEIERVAGDNKLAKPIKLAKRPAVTQNVAAIGYPAYDSRIPETDLMERIYGKIYNKKRLAPGGVTKVEAERILHNCTTLGGNSGSVVIDLDSGEAVGLHNSGSFLTTNYAVRSDVVANRLASLRSGRLRLEASPRPDPAGPSAPAQAGGNVLGSLTIPLTITVTAGGTTGTVDLTVRQPVAAPALPADGAADEVEGEEGRVEDYRDRSGYRPDFLGVEVPLPRIEDAADEILAFEVDGQTETELRYQHYSVVMNEPRRMCFFSAVNINGNLSKKSKRVGWKWDPRIPKSQQIMNECYGSPPRFSRGHMTRREDPAWGDDDAAAMRGNQDSMHVTNTTPQMQAFNSPIWLALEDYALEHAREDKMNISVFTGPYFTEADPTMYGVRIPLSFWKIIAFIHDETGQLTATGYEMDQQQSLPSAEEFVFGAFTSPQLGIAAQVSIRSIEAKSGISFGNLAEADPLAAGEEGRESLAAPRTPILGLDQIRFA